MFNGANGAGYKVGPRTLNDLGAEVIKVESPSGDYIREMTWPIVDGVSLLHLHVHRGKRSIVLDLRKPEGVQIYLELAKDADAVVEAMRPGSLAKRGLGFEQLNTKAFGLLSQAL